MQVKIIVIVTILLIPLFSSLVSGQIPQVIIGGSPTTGGIPNVNIQTPTTTASVNYSSVNVNNSQWLNGLNSTNFWQTSNNQNAMTGTKSGSYHINTSGTINSTTMKTNTLRVSSINSVAPTQFQAISVSNRNLLDVNGNPSILWDMRLLNDYSTANSVDWENRYLYDTTGTYQVVNWGANQLQSNNLGEVVLDWYTQMLYDIALNPSIDWTNRLLKDSYAVSAVDYQNRILIDGFEVISIDWLQRQLYDTSTILSLDWENRNLWDSSNKLAVTYGVSGRKLYSSDGTNYNVDWENGQLAIGGVTNVDWKNKILTGFWNITQGINLGTTNKVIPAISIIAGTTNQVVNGFHNLVIGGTNIITSSQVSIVFGNSNKVGASLSLVTGIQNNASVGNSYDFIMGTYNNATNDSCWVFGDALQCKNTGVQVHGKAYTSTLNNSFSVGYYNTTYIQANGNANQVNLTNTNVNGNLVITGNFSAKRPYWTGYYNGTDNFINTANTQKMNLSNNNDFDAYLISINSSQSIKFQLTGDYLCIVSPEFTNTATTAQIAFWMKKNGADVAWSNSRYSVGNGEYIAPAIPFQFDINNTATDYIEFYWYSTSTNSQLISITGLTSPVRPSVPAVITNCNKISEITP